MAPEHPHRLQDRLAHDRLAEPLDEAGKSGPGLAFALEVDPDQPPSQHQAPGRGVDEQRLALAEVAGPIAEAELVADQPVAGLRVGNPEQGLGEAHQHDTFARAQAVLVQERFDAELVAARFAHAFRKATGARLNAFARIGFDSRRGQQDRERRRLVDAVRAADRGAQRPVPEGRPIVQDTRGDGHGRSISAARDHPGADPTTASQPVPSRFDGCLRDDRRAAAAAAHALSRRPRAPAANRGRNAARAPGARCEPVPRPGDRRSRWSVRRRAPRARTPRSGSRQ